MNNLDSVIEHSEDGNELTKYITVVSATMF
jgi:hypothetical protein